MGNVIQPYIYNNGQVIDANQLDYNFSTLYTLVNGNLDGSNLKTGLNFDSNGIINAKSPAYNASGSALATTGSITSGSFILTLTAALDFVNGQGISIVGAGVSGATLVTSIANGAGTTQLTLNTAASTTVVSAAVGHDDTVAIISAINSISSTGGILIFPKGTYIITSITLSGISNIKLSGYEATLLSTTNNLNFVYISNCTNVIVEGFKLQGTGQIVTLPDGYSYHGLKVSGSTGVRIKDCEVCFFPAGGIMTINCNQVRITDNYCHDNIDMFDIAFGYSTPTASIEQSWILNNRCESYNYWGVHVQGYGKNVNVCNNHVKHKKNYGIMVYDTTAIWEDVVITGNIVEDISDGYNGTTQTYHSGMGIYVVGAKKVTVSNNIVLDVLKNRTDAASPVRTLSPGAISISAADEVTCVGNIIDGSGIDGIDIVNIPNPTNGITVSDNIILGIAFAGVYIQGVQNVIVDNNVIQGNSGNTGIIVYSHSTQPTKEIILANNKIKLFGAGIVVDPNTGSSVDGININGNYVQDITNTFISVVSSNDVSIGNNIIRGVTVKQLASRYAILASSCTNIIVSDNLAKGLSPSFLLERGIAVVSSTNGLVQGNLVKGSNDVYYALYQTGNTNVNFYGNISERQSGPMFGNHNVGNDPSTETDYRVLYRTTIPDASVGYCGQGSICFNLAPVASGTAGWVCVTGGTPGTWKTFGTISA